MDAVRIFFANFVPVTMRLSPDEGYSPRSDSARGSNRI